VNTIQGDEAVYIIHEGRARRLKKDDIADQIPIYESHSRLGCSTKLLPLLEFLEEGGSAALSPTDTHRRLTRDIVIRDFFGELGSIRQRAGHLGLLRLAQFLE
jgi:hypothetical protein